MNKHQIVLLVYIFFWTIVVIDCRNFFCKRTVLWVLLITIFGIMLDTGTVLANCYIAYIEKLSNLRYDMQVIRDTLLLHETKKYANMLLWKTATLGHSFIIGGLEVYIICTLLKKGLISNKKNN